MSPNTTRIFVIALMASLLPACANLRAGQAEIAAPKVIQQSAERYQKEYVLVADDQVEIVVQRTPEVSRIVLIRPDGFLSLPLLNDVRAAGLTPRELTAKLTELFSKRLLNPEVTVIATRVRPATVYVSGEVGNPSAIPLRDAPTAMQAVAITGGFRRSAAVGDVVIIRLSPEGHLQAIRIPAATSGQPGNFMALRMVRLEPDDMVFVPENSRSQFTRFIDDVINKPLSGLQSLFSPLINYKLIQVLDDQSK